MYLKKIKKIMMVKILYICLTHNKFCTAFVKKLSLKLFKIFFSTILFAVTDFKQS